MVATAAMAVLMAVLTAVVAVAVVRQWWWGLAVVAVGAALTVKPEKRQPMRL